MGGHSPTPCSVETSVNLAAAGDASAARARRVYRSPHVRKQTLTWHGMSMGTITTSLCIQQDVTLEPLSNFHPGMSATATLVRPWHVLRQTSLQEPPIREGEFIWTVGSRPLNPNGRPSNMVAYVHGHRDGKGAPQDRILGSYVPFTCSGPSSSHLPTSSASRLPTLNAGLTKQAIAKGRYDYDQTV